VKGKNISYPFPRLGGCCATSRGVLTAD